MKQDVSKIAEVLSLGGGAPTFESWDIAGPVLQVSFRCDRGRSHEGQLDRTRGVVVRFWPAPTDWIKDFNDLSGGIPRVQAYAFAAGSPPKDALTHLLPSGKDLGQLFSEQFEKALLRGDLTAFTSLSEPHDAAQTGTAVPLSENGRSVMLGSLVAGTGFEPVTFRL